jgi:hypothetical protein
MAGFIVEVMQELLIVLTRHVDVDVVVPGDVSLMANGTNERAAGEEVPQSMLHTVLMDMVEDAHLYASQLVYISYLFHLSVNVDAKVIHFVELRELMELKGVKDIISKEVM